MPKTAVVILNWNGLSHLKRFLPGVIASAFLADTRVIVADNGSEDGSAEWLKENLDPADIIQLDKNYGFAEGYNRALQHIEADYYVLLNSDIDTPQGWLEPLISFMETHPDAGACMPKIKSLMQRNYFEYAGAAGGFLDRYGYPFCRGRIFNYTEEDTGQYDETIPVFWASGACFVVRADLYHRAGGLDPDFFAHMEEIDLSWRIQCLGYGIYAVPQSEVFHLGGGSLSMNHPRKTYLNFRNNLFLLVKNLPGRVLWKRLPARLVLDGIAGLKFLLGFEFMNFMAVLRAHFSFYLNAGKMFHKRGIISGCNQIPATIFPRSIAWMFFIRKKRFFHELKNSV